MPEKHLPIYKYSISLLVGITLLASPKNTSSSDMLPTKKVIFKSEYMINNPFINSRYIVWSQHTKDESGTVFKILSFDTMTGNLIEVATDDSLMEMPGDNNIYLGIAHCCWISIDGKGANSFAIKGGKIYQNHSEIKISKERLPWKNANVYNSYVTYFEANDENLCSYVVDLSEVQPKYILLTQKARISTTPRLSHNQVVYEAADDDGNSSIFLYDLDKNTSLKISQDISSLASNPHVTKNYVYYLSSSTSNDIVNVICYDIKSHEYTNIYQLKKGLHINMINNPDSDLLIFSTQGDDSDNTNVICYDPFTRKILCLDKYLSDINMPGSIELNSGCSQARDIVLIVKNVLLVLNVDNYGSISCKYIDKPTSGSMKKRLARIYCNNVIWVESPYGSTISQLYYLSFGK
mgnify:FL=1